MLMVKAMSTFALRGSWLSLINQQTRGDWEVKEIKATAPTLEELYHEYKRLIEIAKIAFTKSRMSSEYESAWNELIALENKTND